MHPKGGLTKLPKGQVLKMGFLGTNRIAKRLAGFFTFGGEKKRTCRGEFPKEGSKGGGPQ